MTYVIHMGHNFFFASDYTMTLLTPVFQCLVGGNFELIRSAYMTALLLHPKLYLGEELSSFLEEDYWI